MVDPQDRWLQRSTAKPVQDFQQRVVLVHWRAQDVIGILGFPFLVGEIAGSSHRDVPRRLPYVDHRPSRPPYGQLLTVLLEYPRRSIDIPPLRRVSNIDAVTANPAGSGSRRPTADPVRP